MSDESETLARYVGRIAALESALEKAERERDEAQRAKYGTPCSCEAWIEACRQAEAALAAERAEVERLRGALRRVADWKMPPALDLDGKPCSYGSAYGSNGERDLVRAVAKQALGEEIGSLWLSADARASLAASPGESAAGAPGNEWRQGVLDATEFLRQMWDDGDQGNHNDAADLILLRDYADRGKAPGGGESAGTGGGR